MRHEKHGFRDETFSRWHRSLDDTFTFLDIDWTEYCSACYEPLALFEIARDVGQPYKVATVTKKLALRAGLPSYTALYTPDDYGGLSHVRVKTLTPRTTSDFRTASPEELEGLIRRLHTKGCSVCHRKKG